MTLVFPSVSVIVTAKNEQHTVRKSLSALLSQDYPDYEILFVDAGSKDETLNIVSSLLSGHSNLKVIQSSGNPSQCRNIGIRSSFSEIIAFTDADVVVPVNWLKTCVGVLQSQPGLGGVGGPNIPFRHNGRQTVKVVDLMLTTSLGSMRSAQSYGFKEAIEVKSIPCCNAVYRRSAIAEVGGFDEALVGCDDTDLGYRIRRAGRRLLFEPKAAVLHSVKFGTLRGFARMIFKYGRGRGYAARKRRYLMSGPAIPAVGMMILFPLLLIGGGISGSFLFLGIPLFVYLSSIEAYSIFVAVARKVPIAALLGSFILVTEHFSYLAGFVAGLFDRRASHWSGNL